MTYNTIQIHKFYLIIIKNIILNKLKCIQLNLTTYVFT